MDTISHVNSLCCCYAGHEDQMVAWWKGGKGGRESGHQLLETSILPTVSNKGEILTEILVDFSRLRSVSLIFKCSIDSISTYNMDNAGCRGEHWVWGPGKLWKRQGGTIGSLATYRSYASDSSTFVGHRLASCGRSHLWRPRGHRTDGAA